MTSTPHRPARLGAAPAVPGPRAVDEPRPGIPDHAEQIAPFVAWLATQKLGETIRREYREAVEEYLTWCHADQGPRDGRRRRYEVHLGRSAPQRLAAARAGLDRYGQYREIVALTLPIDR